MKEMETTKQLDQLVDDYRHGALTRRSFMKQAAALGVTAGAAGSILATGSVAHADGHVQKGGTLREGYDCLLYTSDAADE